jgi:hypothetical protein
VAEGFLEEHGSVSWGDVEASLASAACPKLGGYWRFAGCAYRKGSGTCCEPDLLPTCPLPRHDLRNGHLNQLAYSLFLFIRDVADGDLVAWIDCQLDEASDGGSGGRLVNLREALVGPLRNVYGISDKVAAMAMSSLLMAARQRSRWFEVGASFVVVDTLVHNFLHRTGILARFAADHPYGAGCFAPGGCADLLQCIARQIDAAAFNRAFPRVFPRFVQNAVWRYCAESGLDVCNGNRIHDTGRCDNGHCRLRSICDRVALHTKNDENRVFSAV